MVGTDAGRGEGGDAGVAAAREHLRHCWDLLVAMVTAGDAWPAPSPDR
jgi:hypothetical protein